VTFEQIVEPTFVATYGVNCVTFAGSLETIWTVISGEFSLEILHAERRGIAADCSPLDPLPHHLSLHCCYCCTFVTLLVEGCSTVVTLLFHRSYTAVTLLLHCCYTAVTLLLHCCYTAVTLLLHCCYTAVTLLLQCCYTIVTLLPHCCNTVVTLSHCCYTVVTEGQRASLDGIHGLPDPVCVCVSVCVCVCVRVCVCVCVRVCVPREDTTA
jgi:hypothetical protein